MGDDRDDPDRGAILERRRVLIALALSGLTSVAACSDPSPLACLEPVPPPDETAPAEVQGESPPVREEPEAVPCLSVIDEEHIGVIEGENAEDDGDDPQDRDEEGDEARPLPRPCLSVRRPDPPLRPCLEPPVPPR